MSPTRRRLPRIPVGPLGGFKVTLKQMLLPRVTVEYPKEKRPKPPRAHGRHVLNRYEDGMEKCIGCELCAGVCPADCIYVRGKDNDPEHPTSPGERYGYVYEINYLRCIHCDLCVEACPTEAITESKLFEFSFTNRTDAIYTKRELVVDDEGKPRRQPWEDWREGDDLYTSAWMRATSPAGDPAYEGVVGWSGELGYGVRAPEGGQSGRRDDARTGNRSLREMLALHLDDWERPPEQRGLRGALQRARTRVERKLPGHRPPGGAFPVPPPAPPGLPEDQLDEPDEVAAAPVVAPQAAGPMEGGEG
ncbi:NADH-quinone oxidoreductase subunit NuoI [Aciditerrimonas ferrireducens]|jgi:NADH-quinone oxidoreductase subunit I|uniref:NADH-quinone oxidoreductase subunit I n=1 Tax=Aciditerrimonas ferrireducens TaxID=667306 RepID=A0ABV6C3I7_9ACTN